MQIKITKTALAARLEGTGKDWGISDDVPEDITTLLVIKKLFIFSISITLHCTEEKL